MNDKLKEFLKKFEGAESHVYKDTSDIPTVGHGVNLNSPDVPKILEDLGTSRERMIAGEKMSSEMADKALDAQIAEKQKVLNQMKDNSFPNANLKDHEYDALTAAIFNSPKILGPKLRENLDKNDRLGALRELLTQSNKEGLPGIAKRRIAESKYYAGDDFTPMAESLDEMDRVKVLDEMSKMEPTAEKEEIYKANPWMRFNKFRPK